MKTISRSHPYLWITLILVAFLAVCAWLARRPAVPVAAPPARPQLLVRSGDELRVPEDSALRARLVVAQAQEQASPPDVSLPAVVEADPATTFSISPPATGRVTALKVRLGEKVRRGQLLATIAAPDYAQAVTDAQKARDALQLAQAAAVRAHGVNQAGSNAAKDVEAADSAVVQAAAELRRSEARLRSMSVDDPRAANGVALLSVIAPADGTVTALSTAAGAVLNDPTVSLMTISNLDHVWVTANVPENLAWAVHAGESARVVLAAFPDEVHDGKIAFVDSLLDADSRRIKARIVFANPAGLFKPNMFATARLALPPAPQVQVPSSALLMNNDSVSVFVELRPWTFQRRPVEIGREDGERVLVRSGLRAGERIVVRGGVLLND